MEKMRRRDQIPLRLVYSNVKHNSTFEYILTFDQMLRLDTDEYAPFDNKGFVKVDSLFMDKGARKLMHIGQAKVCDTSLAKVSFDFEFTHRFGHDDIRFNAMSATFSGPILVECKDWRGNLFRDECLVSNWVVPCTLEFEYPLEIPMELDYIRPKKHKYW